jgi:hypothetical protein
LPLPAAWQPELIAHDVWKTGLTSVVNDFAGPLQSGVNSAFFEQAFIKMSKATKGKENFRILNPGESVIDIF